MENLRGSRKPWPNSNRMQQEKWGEKEGKAVVEWRRENKHTRDFKGISLFFFFFSVAAVVIADF